MTNKTQPLPTQATDKSPQHSSRRRLLLAVLLLLLVGGGVGLAVWPRGNSENPEGRLKTGGGEVAGDPDPSPADTDPKGFEPLEYGPPIVTEFNPALLDALDPKKIPAV